MDSIRQNKVARLIQRDLSEMFQQECKEYTEGAMLSVTAVRVSPDLSYAKIYVSIFPSERVEAVMKSLEEKNKSRIQGESKCSFYKPNGTREQKIL